jgi:hypothetical protein
MEAITMKFIYIVFLSFALVLGITNAAANPSIIGQLQGLNYINNDMGFSATFPKNWFVVNKVGKHYINSLGNKIIAKHDKHIAKIAASAPKINLFTLSQKPLGSPNNAEIILTLVNRKLTKAKTALIILQNISQALHKVVNVISEEPIARVKIGGKQFYNKNVLMLMRGHKIVSKQYLAFQHSYVMILTVSHQKDNQQAAQAIEGFLQSIRFHSNS